MPPYYQQEPRKSFRALVAEHIITCLTESMAHQAPDRRGNNVLVVDELALSILNAAVSQNDLLKAGFMTVCPFESKRDLADGLRRRRYTALDALYFMKAKKPNIMRVLDDYKQDAPPPPPDMLEKLFPCILRGIPAVEPEPVMYADCRLLIIPGLTQRAGIANWELMHDFLHNQVTNRGVELAKLGASFKDDSDVKECTVEVMAYESSVFSLDMPDTLSNVYPHALVASNIDPETVESERHRVLDHLDDIAHRLASALVTIGEYPYVRYVHSGRGVSEHVARSLVSKLREYRETHPSFIPWGDSKAYEDPKTGNRRPGPMEAAQVLIVDRVDDLAPAIMHDVTYQALVSDLLDHEPTTPFKHTYMKSGTRISKDVMLDESDPVWRAVRNEDMGSSMEALEDAWKVIADRKEARSKLNRNDPSDLRELMSVLAGDEKLVEEKVALHYRISTRIVEEYEKLSLQDVMTLEQVLVTGCDAEGNTFSNKKVEAELRILLQNQSLGSDHKTRLLLLWLLCSKSIDSKTRKELIQTANLSKDDALALGNIPDLHMPASRSSSEPRADGAPFFDDAAMSRNKKMAKEGKKLCRYVFKAEEMLKNLIDDTLSEDAYPWVRGPPAKGSGGGMGSGAAGMRLIDPRTMEPIGAFHGGHGEARDRYTAAALQAGPSDAAKSKASKKSKFTKDEGGMGGGAVGAGAGGGGASGGAGAGGAEANPLGRYLEPIKPKYYEGGRIVVFFVGGVAQSEMAAIEKLSKETGREIIVGGTSILTARDFLEQLTATDPDAGLDDENGRGLGAGIGDLMKGSGVDDF